MNSKPTWTSWGEPFKRDGQPHKFVNAVCGCGSVVVVRLQKDGTPRTLRCRSCQHKLRVTHGHSAFRSPSKTYTCWQSMLDRCTNEKSRGYPEYGARGITVCVRWLESFENFLADMGERPPGLTIDRIDNGAGYSPQNCRWATRKEQNRNTRQNVLITYNGETLCVGEWAERIGCKDGSLFNRIRRGWDVDRAMTEPFDDTINVRRRGNDYATLTYGGETLTLFQWGEKLGIGRTTLQERVRAGWSVEKTLTTPSLLRGVPRGPRGPYGPHRRPRAKRAA